MAPNPLGEESGAAGGSRARLRRVDQVLLVAAAAALLWAVVDRISRAGPLRLERPASVLANVDPWTRRLSPYLVFLDGLKAALPAGARVTVLSADLDPDCLIASGRLSGQQVIGPCDFRRALPGAGNADYVATFPAPLAAPPPGSVSPVSQGFLYHRTR